MNKILHLAPAEGPLGPPYYGPYSPLFSTHPAPNPSFSPFSDHAFQPFSAPLRVPPPPLPGEAQDFLTHPPFFVLVKSPVFMRPSPPKTAHLSPPRLTSCYRLHVAVHTFYGFSSPPHFGPLYTLAKGSFIL